MKTLPGEVPPVLNAALNKQSPERREALVERIVGDGTSADYLSDWLRRAGTPVGATTIKKFRRAIRDRHTA